MTPNIELVARLLAAKSSTPDVRSVIVCRSPHPSLIAETTAVIDVTALDQLLPR